MARQVTPEERERARRGGEWLRAQRQARGFATGTDFAEALGIKQVRLSSYENGHHLVEVGIARRIADVLGMSEVAVWRGLELPLPAELRTDAEVVEWAWREAAELMEQIPEVRDQVRGRTRPPVGRKPTRVTRTGGKPNLPSQGRESAV